MALEVTVPVIEVDGGSMAIVGLLVGLPELKAASPLVPAVPTVPLTASAGILCKCALPAVVGLVFIQ